MAKHATSLARSATTHPHPRPQARKGLGKRDALVGKREQTRLAAGGEALERDHVALDDVALVPRDPKIALGFGTRIASVVRGMVRARQS